MRKALLSLAVLAFMAGLVVATEVTVVKYDKDKKEVTVKEGDKEKTYKLTDTTKVTVTDKDGNKTDGKVEDLTQRLERASKADAGGKRGPMKMDITTEGDKITEVKYQRRGKKN